MSMPAGTKDEKRRILLKRGIPPWEVALLTEYQLSSRNITILKVVLEGETHAKSAKRMNLVHKSIRYHVGVIYDRLGLKPRTLVQLYKFIEKLKKDLENRYIKEVARLTMQATPTQYKEKQLKRLNRGYQLNQQIN